MNLNEVRQRGGVHHYCLKQGMEWMALHKVPNHQVMDDAHAAIDRLDDIREHAQAVMEHLKKNSKYVVSPSKYAAIYHQIAEAVRLA